MSNPIMGYPEYGRWNSPENGRYFKSLDFWTNLKDCFSGNIGEYQYKEGKRLSVTKNGFTCQRWDEDYPHNARGNAPFAPKLRANNFCSDHDGETAWCYTTDPEQRYDYCDVTWV